MMLNKCNMFDMDDIENASEGRNRYGLNKQLATLPPPYTHIV